MMVEKLDKHQERIEGLFKVYYDTLDEMRNQYLGQEYRIRETMDSFERSIQVLMKDIKRYNFIEFYHEQHNLHQQIRDIRTDLKTFNVYMPKYQMKVEDMKHATNQIKVDIKERLNGYFHQTDHNFALGNYEYVTKTLNNDAIMKIYK